MTAHERNRAGRPGWTRGVAIAAALFATIMTIVPVHAQVVGRQGIALGDSVISVDMAIGRSIPMTTAAAIQRVSVANPEVADVVLIAEREMVVNALASGLTDLIIWQTDGRKFHYRVSVHSPTDRKQVILQVRIAETSRDFLRSIGASFLWQDQHGRIGTGAFTTQGVRDEEGNVSIRQAGQFATLLSLDDIENLTALLEVAEQSGRFKTLAEPNLIAANGEEAVFLAGGELPVPVAQPAAVGGVQAVSIQYREFGIRLSFVPEILSEDLIKIKIGPEVSNLDFSNAIEISGFLVPALQTRRASTTVDLRQGQTLAIAGLLSSEEQKIHTGVPILKDIPILGLLFSSQRFQRNETELLILVTPRIVDPMAPTQQRPPLPGDDAEPGDRD